MKKRLIYLVILACVGYFVYREVRPRSSGFEDLAPQGEVTDAAHPAQAQGWVDTRLYFGLGAADVPNQGVSEIVWRAFLDKEVTPRFPSGLSVIDVYGQWQGPEQKVPSRVRTKLLVIDYPENADNEMKVDAIRKAWKQKTGDQSVLKVTSRADVSF